MYYIPPFKVIRERIPVVKVNGTGKINCSQEDFLEVVKLLLRGVAFDEAWYLSKYADVAEAVKNGLFKSGRHHFIEAGYFEGRRPGELELDESWYVKANPDIAKGIGKGDIRSARQHYLDHGYDEGRLPSEL